MLSVIHAIPFPSWISDTAFSIPGTPIAVKWYGLGYIVGITLAYLYARRVCETRDIWIANGVPSRPVIVPNKIILEDLFFYALLGIMIGGRLGSVILYNPGQYLANPLDIFKVWEGGMAFHGGLLGVGAAALLLARKYKIPLGRIADMTALGAAIGIGLVRITNFMNQELWGRAADVPWAFIFDTDAAGLPRHPSQLYEAFLEGLVLFLIIRIATHKFKALTRPGFISALFVFCYGLFRMFVELFREPDASLFGPFTRGMAYSLPMVIGGLIVMIILAKRPPVSPKRIREENAEETEGADG